MFLHGMSVIIVTQKSWSQERLLAFYGVLGIYLR